MVNKFFAFSVFILFAVSIFSVSVVAEQEETGFSKLLSKLFSFFSEPTLTGEVSIQQVCVTPPANMISWWDGDSVSLPTSTVFDIQDGNDGTLLNGATITPGIVGNAFDFEGNQGYIDFGAITNLPSGAQPYTLDFWIKTTTSGNTIVMEKGENLRFAVQTAVGKIKWMSAGQLTSVSTINDGQWHHVALVFSGSDARIYIDGVSDAYDPYHFSAGFSGASFFVGSRPSLPGVSFPGQLDEIEIFNRVLSPAEVADIYNAGVEGKCKVAACGNNLIESPPEVCDGIDLGGQTCTDVVPGSVGTLTCNPDCLGFDTSGCVTCTDVDVDNFSPDGGVCGDIDCNDNDDAIYPGATEICDGKDNDCNGQIDDGYVSTPTTCGVGECASSGTLNCVSGIEVDSCVAGTPELENSDAFCQDTLDNDCDGLTDFPADTNSCTIGGVGQVLELCGVPGDLNNDLVTNILDAIIAQKIGIGFIPSIPGGANCERNVITSAP